MTLEDFFTLTEIKDGLATVARVEELISLLQKQMNNPIDDIVNVAKQWSTVAGTLVATENKDCLQQFAELNGVHFLGQWLRRAVNCSNDANDSLLEELINALLGSLARLPVDNENLILSDIGKTIEHLLGHNSLKIKESARIVLDHWKCARNDALKCQKMDNCAAFVSDRPKSSVNAIEMDVISSTHGEGVFPCKTDVAGGFLGGSAGEEDKMSDSHLDTANNKKKFISDNCPITEESSVCPAASIVSSRCSSIVGHPDAPLSNDAVDGTKEMVVTANKEAILHISSQHSKCSSLSYLSAQKLMNESIDKFDVKERTCISIVSESQSSESNKDKLLKHIRTEMNFDLDVHHPGDFHGQCSKANIKKELESLENSCCLNEIIASGDANLEHDGTAGIDVDRVDAKQAEPKQTGGTDGASELEVECGKVDALGVAQQVARKVEHEVVNHREPYNSSPEVISGETKAHNLDRLEGKNDQTVIKEQDQERLPTAKDVSDIASLPMEDDSKVSEDISTSSEKDEDDIESLKSITADQVPIDKIDDSKFDFDLNADVAIDENDCSMCPSHINPFVLSASKDVVAASNESSGLPVPSFQADEMGWRGSAATTAFHPASYGRTPDRDMTYSGLRQEPEFIGIDLNVAESRVDEAVNPSIVKSLPLSSDFPCGVSSILVSSGRTDRLNLDLNRLEDEEVPPYFSQSWMIYHQKADQGMSSSSASSLRIPSTRDFNLNENLSLFGLGGSQNLSISPLNMSETHESSKHDNSTIKIMGSIINVERKNYTDQSQKSCLGSGMNLGMNMAAGLMLPSLMPPAAYGHSVIGRESVVPIHSARHILQAAPYTVGSNSTVVIPQFLNSAGQNAASSYFHHFGTMRDFLRWNEPASFQPALDPNSGMSTIESGSRQPASFEDSHGFSEEQGTSQPESSGTAVKRKEPDSGWDSHASG